MKIVLGVLVGILVVLGGINLTKKDDGGTNNQESSVDAPEETAKVAPSEKASSTPAEVSAVPSGPPAKEDVDLNSLSYEDPKNWKPDRMPPEGGYLPDFDINGKFALKKDDSYFISTGGQPLKEVPKGIRVLAEETKKDWIQKIVKDLESGGGLKNSTIAVKKLNKKFIVVNGNTGFPVESASISFTTNDGTEIGYKALVNTANSAMMLLFNTTKNGKAVGPAAFQSKDQ